MIIINPNNLDKILLKCLREVKGQNKVLPWINYWLHETESYKYVDEWDVGNDWVEDSLVFIKNKNPEILKKMYKKFLKYQQKGYWEINA